MARASPRKIAATLRPFHPSVFATHANQLFLLSDGRGGNAVHIMDRICSCTVITASLKTRLDDSPDPSDGLNNFLDINFSIRLAMEKLDTVLHRLVAKLSRLQEEFAARPAAIGTEAEPGNPWEDPVADRSGGRDRCGFAVKKEAPITQCQGSATGWSGGYAGGSHLAALRLEDRAADYFRDLWDYGVA